MGILRHFLSNRWLYNYIFFQFLWPESPFGKSFIRREIFLKVLLKGLNTKCKHVRFFYDSFFFENCKIFYCLFVKYLIPARRGSLLWSLHPHMRNFWGHQKVALRHHCPHAVCGPRWSPLRWLTSWQGWVSRSPLTRLKNKQTNN